MSTFSLLFLCEISQPCSKRKKKREMEWSRRRPLPSDRESNCKMRQFIKRRGNSRFRFISSLTNRNISYSDFIFHVHLKGYKVSHRLIDDAIYPVHIFGAIFYCRYRHYIISQREPCVIAFVAFNARAISETLKYQYLYWEYENIWIRLESYALNFLSLSR